jgi:hypothetical protein
MKPIYTFSAAEQRYFSKLQAEAESAQKVIDSANQALRAGITLIIEQNELGQGPFQLTGDKTGLVVVEKPQDFGQTAA